MSATDRMHDDADHGDRRTPAGQGQAEGRGETVPSGEGDGRERSDEPTKPQGGVERSDARIAKSEQLDRRDDHEDGEQPANEGLQPEREDDDPWPRQLDQRPDPGGELIEDGSCRGVGPPDRRDVQARDRQHARGIDREDRDGRAQRPGRDEQDPGERRAEEGAEALGGTGRDVGGHELGRRRGDGGQQGHVQWTRERSDAGFEGDDGEQERDRQVQPHHDDRQADGHGPDRVHRPQHDLRPPAHRRQAGERRDQRGHQEAGEPEDAHGDRAPGLVRREERRDEECPFARADREPRDGQPLEAGGPRASSGAR